MANPEGQAFQFKDRRADALGNFRVLLDEIVCSILEYLCPRDVARLSCVSSVMYILCNEEPLWMTLCLKKANSSLQYKGSWKKTTLYIEQVPIKYIELGRSPLPFDGFSSDFLYRRMYRCNTSLDGFAMDTGNVERKEGLSLEEFQHDFNWKKPVLLNGLADTWPARKLWTIDELLVNHGDTTFRISQRSSQKISMTLKNYATYMSSQHDEDPLYIFDDKFGEVDPGLLKEYDVPYLFQEDFFDVLDLDQRPPYRWLIIGPERSGASWHVDPALTSAWNTLLCGRKRWALYPPGKVPLGVTVHVNDEDGDVNIDTPTSLQWWLDYYPLLSDEDKPIECTQLPGETIFVPSGWWHCILNLEITVAVTQNFVNAENFEFVCLDMAPGYSHKGVSRVGLLAADDAPVVEDPVMDFCEEDNMSYSDLSRREKRSRIQLEENGVCRTSDLQEKEFSYDIDFLSMFLDPDRDHYNSQWSSGNCIGPREMREWLYKLWVGKPGMRELIWKGSCIALNSGKWFDCLTKICTFHELSHPTEEQKHPVGTGSNPVYLMSDHVVKIYLEGGLEHAMYCLGTELEFYTNLHEANSPLQNYMPEILASGILYLEDGSYTIVPWDGQGVPNVIAERNLLQGKCGDDGFPFGLWNKKQYELKKAGKDDSVPPTECPPIWPYVITKRCKGKIFAQLRDTLTSQETSNLASFLGEQLRNLHLLPLPPFTCESFLGNMELASESKVAAEWEGFIKTLSRKKKDASSQLRKWGDPIPSRLIEKVDEYLPDDLRKFFHITEDKLVEECKPSWIHSDIMDDNIIMKPCSSNSHHNERSAEVADNGSSKEQNGVEGEGSSWRLSHILDFSDLSTGDPIYDLIPIHLDVFRGDTHLLKQLLQSYRLPLLKGSLQKETKFMRLSYRTMCYCILHDENVLGAIFSIWKELREAESWEEVENVVWGDLNTYCSVSKSSVSDPYS